MSTRPGPEARPDRPIRRLTIAFCLVAIVLAAVQAWTARFDMNPDGIQYLDNADAYRSGDLAHAVNSQWSPLYPWLIGALFNVARPAANQEFPLVHALNFLLLALSLAAFLFFMTALRPHLGLSPLLLSYAAFLYCSLDLTNLRNVTPDLLVNSFIFLAAGLLVRMASGAAQARHFAALGVTLGVGYLAKTPFLLFGLLCLGMAAILARKRPLALLRTALAAALFLAIVSPYVWMLSSAEGRFTFGDSGKFNVIWMVNGVPYRNWQGGPPENGRPLHPTRQLSTGPAIFEFAAPVGGTYPPWYNPIYWNEGARIAWRPTDFARALLTQARLYGYLLQHRQIPLVFALIVLLILTPAKREIPRRLHPLWPVLLLGAAPFAMYAPVHAEARYLASFFILLWTALFVGVFRGIQEPDARASRAIAAVAASLMFAEALAAAFPPSPIRYAHDAPAVDSARQQYEIARSLEALGLKPGDSVAIVSSDLPYSWARLARARITMEVSAAVPTALEIACQHNIRFVVAPAAPALSDQPGWLPLGNTATSAYPCTSEKNTGHASK